MKKNGHVKKEEKVGAITKTNYGEVVDRANHLREKLKAHYQTHKGFPSLRFIIENWGYNISLKALCRHRAKVMEAMGIKHLGKPTHVLPRPKKEKGPSKNAKPATAHAATAHTTTKPKQPMEKAKKATPPPAAVAAPATEKPAETTVKTEATA